MKVLHLGKFYPPFAGGIENFMGDLLPALENLGVKVFALVHNHHFYRRLSATINNNSNLLRVPCYGTLLYAPISPYFPIALKKSIFSFAPNILHLHLPNTSAFYALFCSSALKIPWVVHWHSDVVQSKFDRRLKLAYPIYRIFEKAILRKAAVIIAASPPYLLSSIALKPWRYKCCVVPYGIDRTRLPPPQKNDFIWANAQWPEQSLRVLTVGRLTYYKGHDVLIRAAAVTANSLQVLIVGRGDKIKAHRQLIDRLGLNERVKLLGEIATPQLQALMATCDCLCLPSIERTEAFGLVLPEAMSHGKPVVSSDIAGSGVGWVVQHEKTGILVRPGDHQALAGAFDRLAQEPELGRRLGAAAGQHFLKEFRIEKLAERIKRIYFNLFNDSR